MTNVSENLTIREPDGPAPRGTVIVVAGRGEHPEVYRRFGTRLAFDAYRVHVIADPTADPESGRAQIAGVATGETPSPVVLVGSDAGAWFAAALAAEDDTTPAGDWDDELDARTTCPTHRGRISDALVVPGALYAAIPAGWTQGAALEQITIPTLAIHGCDDPISPLEDARETFAAVSDLELVSVTGARHDVLNDQSHRSVAATVVLWLERLRLEAGLAPIVTVRTLGAGRV
jgi:pimeloyl-ACP methyl ester carboxylesterase